MYRIGALPERLESDTAQRVDETLTLVAHSAIGLDNPFDGARHLVPRQRRTYHLAECREAVGRAAKGELIPLLTALLDAEDPDVADMMVAAAVHAARDLDLDLAEVVQVVQVIEPRLDLLR